MHFADIQNCTHPLQTSIKVGICNSFFSRLKGWMFSPRIGSDEGLILIQDKESRLDAAIHMFFVGFDLGVIWLDNNLKVVDQVRARSWSPFYQPAHPARMILEIHPDRLPEFNIGDEIQLEHD